VSIVRVVLSIFLFAFSAQGQEQRLAHPSPTPGETCTVEGETVKATTGEGLKKMTVQLFSMERGGEPLSTLTDANGRFVFSGVEPGGYSLMASGNGYPSQRYGQRGRFDAGKILKLTPGRTEKDIVFRLQPPGVITGTIYDEDGGPAVRAQVQAVRSVRQGSRHVFMPVMGAETDDRGEYRIFGLEPDQYLVVATYQRQQVAPSDPGDDVYVPTFHPGAPDSGQATLIEVKPGDVVSDINVDLRLLHGVRVRGSVRGGPPPKTQAGMWVSLQKRDSELQLAANYGASVQNETGSFEIRGVPPGSYYLTGGWGDGKQQYYGRTPLDVGTADADGVNLLLGVPVQLPGSFHTDPAEKLDFSALNLWLQPVDSGMDGGSASVKPDGTFVIENLHDGNYRLQVGGFPEQYYVKSARLGGMEVLGPGLNISHSQPPGQLEVTLTLNGGRVDGTVVKERKPSGYALVVLVPDPPLRDHSELYSSKSCDALGRYSLLGLPPGDFKLFAWEPRQGLDFSDPDFMKVYEGRGTQVHIEESRRLAVQLEVIPAEEEPQQ
jgi:hypothetical protein